MLFTTPMSSSLSAVDIMKTSPSSTGYRAENIDAHSQESNDFLFGIVFLKGHSNPDAQRKRWSISKSGVANAKQKEHNTGQLSLGWPVPFALTAKPLR